MRILTYIISPTSIRIYSLMFCSSHIFNQLYPKTKQRKNKNQPRTIQYFDQRSTNHALNDERDISPSLFLLGREKLFLYQFQGLLIEYTERNCSLDLLAALRATVEPITWLFRLWKERERNGAQVRSDWKRGRKSVARVGGGWPRSMETFERRIICLVHRATEPDGPLTEAKWGSGDYRYKVTPFEIFLDPSSLSPRYLDNESGLKFHLSLRIVVVRIFETVDDPFKKTFRMDELE